MLGDMEENNEVPMRWGYQYRDKTMVKAKHRRELQDKWSMSLRNDCPWVFCTHLSSIHMSLGSMGVSPHPQVTILNGSDIRSLYNFSGEQVRTPPLQPSLALCQPSPGPKSVSSAQLLRLPGVPDFPPQPLLIDSLVLTRRCRSVRPPRWPPILAMQWLPQTSTGMGE